MEQEREAVMIALIDKSVDLFDNLTAYLRELTWWELLWFRRFKRPHEDYAKLRWMVNECAAVMQVVDTLLIDFPAIDKTRVAVSSAFLIDTLYECRLEGLQDTEMMEDAAARVFPYLFPTVDPTTN